jgi:hypothetical protein
VHGARSPDRVRRSTRARRPFTVRCCQRASSMAWRGREARNEARFRDQNEWIEATVDGFGSQPRSERLITFVCECGDGSCTQPIELTRSEYESVRVERSACHAFRTRDRRLSDRRTRRPVPPAMLGALVRADRHVTSTLSCWHAAVIFVIDRGVPRGDVLNRAEGRRNALAHG